MPEFRVWRSEQFLRELDGTDVHMKRKRSEQVG
jgi:hypothetical protein